MNAVRDMRLAAGLTQAELAERSGVAQPNIAAYEVGARTPSRAMIERFRAVAKPRPSKALADHREAILGLAQQHKARDVRVFGSVARGQDTSGSDIDLLVRFEPEADLFDLADFVLALEDLTGVHVDVVSEHGLRSGPNRIRDEAVAL